MARQCGMHLISTLRCDAALYLPYDGPSQGRGPYRKYGAKLEDRHLPDAALQQLSEADGIETRISQAEVLHKEFDQRLHVVILEQVKLTTQARAPVILFSSDLALPYDQLITDYSVRFQIEFSFRDAKQYGGLDDCMQITATGVTTAANLARFMVNLVYVLLRERRRGDVQWSVLDLKAEGRGYKYVLETIKLLPESPDEDLIAELFRHVARLGRIHPAEGRPRAA